MARKSRKSIDPAYEQARKTLAQKLDQHAVKIGENHTFDQRIAALPAHFAYALLLRSLRAQLQPVCSGTEAGKARRERVRLCRFFIPHLID